MAVGMVVWTWRYVNVCDVGNFRSIEGIETTGWQSETVGMLIF